MIVMIGPQKTHLIFLVQTEQINRLNPLTRIRPNGMDGNPEGSWTERSRNKALTLISGKYLRTISFLLFHCLCSVDQHLRFCKPFSPLMTNHGKLIKMSTSCRSSTTSLLTLIGLLDRIDLVFHLLLLGQKN